MAEQVKPEVVIDVVAYEAPPKDSDGNLIKENGKTVKGAVLDTGTCYEHSQDQKGFDAMVKRHGIKKVVNNNNRQEKTDCRNALAADAKNAKDPTRKVARDIKKVSKAITEEKRKDLNTRLAALLAEYEDVE